MEHKDCVFCQISSGLETNSKILKRGEKVFLLPDINPVSRGHALVITREHYQDLSSSSDEALQEAIIFAKDYANSLKEKFPEIKGFNYISNQGAEAKQVVFHFHLHVIPRW
ncbi:HIT family protein [Mycoplasma suis]|uniref:HIT protein n=1 Tax=Mycoplasma suis (strain Illinois) TaxID=768700 RepID=F0QR84_MYCSL|nr:HIT domain-containing protein [Mycoplasma suis]ADX98004.1 HIT protein [Mycoplasma suis str. Illinois]